MWVRIITAAALASCALLPLSGCGGSGSGPALAPVSGTVKLDGKAAAGVAVVFVPKEKTRGEGGNGLVDQDGRYELKYRGAKKGVPPGEYKVICQKLAMPDGSPFDPSKGSPADVGAKQVLPPTYSDERETTLKATVPPEGGKFDFDLKSSG